MRARGIERDAAGFERAQIGDRGCERESELLRFRAAGIVDDAPVGDRERPAKALLCELADDCRRKPCDELAPRHRAGAASRP